MSRHAAEGRLDRLREVMSEGVRTVGVFTVFAECDHDRRLAAPGPRARAQGAGRVGGRRGVGACAS